MRTRPVRTVAALAIIAAATSAGCGSTASTSSAPEHAATSTIAASAPQLAGSYVRTVTKADIARTNSFRKKAPGQTAPPAGTAHLIFTSGSFRFVDSTGFAIPETYSATGGGTLNVKLYVNPDVAAFCGPDIPQAALYRWSVSGNTLTLTAVRDKCADRDSVLAGRWTRTGS